jgi:serine/threonine protein kinase
MKTGVIWKGKFLWDDFDTSYKLKTTRGSKTQNEVFVGTDKYAAPELMQEGTQHGRATDIFALGCVYLETFERSPERRPL